jgi:Ca2+-binding RTX toxin-like protein
MRAKPPGGIALATVLLALFASAGYAGTFFGNGGELHTLSTSGHDDIFGRAGDDTLYGEGWTHILNGNADNDMLYGGPDDT